MQSQKLSSMHTKKLVSVIVAINSMLACGLSRAETAPQVTSLEEVVVTARKREEALQSVPLAITAMTGDMLARNNVTNVTSLATQSPSLVINNGSGAGKSVPTIALRGLSQQELTIVADPSVTVYFGDLVIARSQGLNQSMYDLQSVEVLKGPQGTLFGRNSTGGAISIKPNLPVDQFEGYVDGTIGNLGRKNTSVMINAPVNDVVQFRFSGQSTKSDGYLRDVILNKNINDEDTKSGRISMRIAPSDALESTFVYNRFLEHDGGTGAEIITSSPIPSLLATQQALGIYKTESGANQYTHVATEDYANTTTYALTDQLSIKNIIGYRKVGSQSSDDVDGTALAILPIARNEHLQQFSEEFQIFGSTDELDWLAGYYHFHEQGNDYDTSAVFGQTTQIPQPLPQGFPGQWAVTDVSGNNKSDALFGQATYKLTDDLSLTGGLRYTKDRKEVTARSMNSGGTLCSFTLNGSLPPIDQCRFNDSKEFGQLTYSFTADYKLTPDALIYLTRRKGYRSGGFGARGESDTVLSETFKPETVTDWEFGTKDDWRFLGMSARTNLAIFKSDYRDIQRLISDTITNSGGQQQTVTFPANGQRASIDGAELEVTLIPVAGLELSGFYSYTHTKYEKFITTDPFSGSTNDLAHGPFARSPLNTYSLTARYTLPIDTSIGDVSFQANYWHTDRYTGNDTYFPGVYIEGYHLVNLHADWKRVMSSPFDVSLFCNNATATKYVLPTIYIQGFFSSVTPGEPRTYGLEVKYRFGELAKQ